MESQWDTLPPEMQEKILFWKAVAGTREKFSKVVDELKGGNLSGFPVLTDERHDIFLAYVLVRYNKGKVLAELQYGDTEFSPIKIAWIKKEFKNELDEIECKNLKLNFVAQKCDEMYDCGEDIEQCLYYECVNML